MNHVGVGMGADPADELFLARFAPGTVIGGYTLERRLGQGGMASVFLATDNRLGRHVALKILPPGAAADEGFRQRFLRESRLAAAVDDPHVIPVHEAGEDDGVLYLAMRYVPGGDTRTLLRSGRLSPARAAAIISPVASALDAAHAAGLVHRDVKPANILIDTRPGRPDHVYLADFGISKAAGRATTALTGTGNFIGTLDYIAPEQIRAQELTGAADQYSLACTAYELLTGQPPFTSAEPTALIAAHLLDPPPAPSAHDARLAAADPVFARALAKDPAARYPACHDFADDLRTTLGLAPYHATDPEPEPALDTGPAPSRDLPPRERPRPAPAAGSDGQRTADAPAAVASPGTAEQPADPREASLDGTTVTRDPSHSTPGAGKPSRYIVQPNPQHRRRLLFTGMTAVFAAALISVISYLILPLNSGGGPRQSSGHHNSEPTVLRTLSKVLRNPRSQGVSSVAFGPGRTTLATADGNGNTYLWNLATKTVTATLHDPRAEGSTRAEGVSSVAFGPGRTTLATADGNTYLWNLATKTITATLHDPQSQGVSSVAFGPGRTTLATADGNGNTYLWNLATKTITATLRRPQGYTVGAIYSMAFSPGGTTLAAGDILGSTYLWNLTTKTITATLHRPTLHDIPAQAVHSVAFSPDGTTLAAGENNGSTYLWNLATKTITASFHDPQSQGVNSGVRSVAFSPDGTTLAVGDSNGSTYLWNLATKTITATLRQGYAFPVDSVAFSPGGTTLAVGDANGSTYLWTR